MAVRDFFIPVADIDTAIIDRIDNFSFDSVWESLAPPEEEPLRGRRFKELFRKTVEDYTKYFPVLHLMDFTANPIYGAYNFFSNFESYLVGAIGDSELILVPSMILQINGSGKNIRFAAYNKPTLISRLTIETMLAKCDHPWHFEVEPSGKYTQNSGLYGVADRDKFLTFFEVQYCRFIRSEREHARLQLPIELYGNVDDLLAIAEDQRATYIRTNSTPMDMWGMKKF